MHLKYWLHSVLSICLVSARSLRGTEFRLNGSAFKFIGTNAYWLHTLNTDADISNTFASISAAGIKVVRIWAFNDVHDVPINRTWFQMIANGTTTINNGTNGLPRLDKVVELAEQHGIYLLLSLTNNWNPQPGLNTNKTTSAPSMTRRNVDTGNTLNRNYLSNDYGGMDAYVRQLGVHNKHDEFYTNATIIEHFKNYTTNIVSRYINSPAIFAWELANDPRCNSTLPSRADCTAQTITKWHSTLAKHIRSVDPNHLVCSGNHGFFCTDCPKLFPIPTTPAPQPSAAPGQRRRKLALLTKKDLIKERVERRKQAREHRKRTGALEELGVRIRGRWTSTPTRQQDSNLGSAFDGSQGVDSEDILGIPEIGFSSFQLFPDQNHYAAYNPHLPSFNNTVQAGIDWLDKQLQSAALYGKPSALTGFGLVTQSNAPDYIPFNSAAVGNVTSMTLISDAPAIQTSGISDDQRDDAYQQWMQSGISGGINGMIQYQWGQSNLTAAVGTTVSPDSTATSPSSSSGNPTSPVQNQTNVSPDDGYSISGVGEDNVQSILTDGAQQIGGEGNQA